MIGIDKINDSGYSFKFPTIDFKFQNTGNATAFLWKFEISVIHAEVDLTPVLEFSADERHKALEVSITNNGWGAARDFRLEIEEPSLNLVFPASARQFQGSIESGQSEMLRLTRHDVDPGRFETLSRRFVDLYAAGRQNDYYIPYRLSAEGRSLYGVRLENLKATWECRDERGNAHKGKASVRMGGRYSYLALTADGFVEIRLPPPCGAAAPSGATFITIIDPAKGAHDVSYLISRKIPPGDIERFHIMVGANMSCHLNLRFRFYVDKETRIESEAFDVNIWNPRNSGWNWDYQDGAEVSRPEVEGRSSPRWGRVRERKSSFPFLDDLEDSR